MTAENRAVRTSGAEDGVASMRPRPMTAENGPGCTPAPAGRRRFNEAAADDRGKLDRPLNGPSDRPLLQ